MSSFSKVLMSVAALNGVLAINMDNPDCESKLGKGATGRGKRSLNLRDYRRNPLTAEEKARIAQAQRYNAKHTELASARNEIVKAKQNEVYQALTEGLQQGNIPKPKITARVRRSTVTGSTDRDRALYYLSFHKNGEEMRMYRPVTYTSMALLQRQCPGAPAMTSRHLVWSSTSDSTRKTRGDRFEQILDYALLHRDNNGIYRALLNTFFPAQGEDCHRFMLWAMDGEVPNFDLTLAANSQVPQIEFCDVQAALAAEEDKLNAIAVVASEESQEELGGEQTQQPQIKIEMPKQGNIALQASVLLKQASLKTTTTGAAA